MVWSVLMIMLGIQANSKQETDRSKYRETDRLTADKQVDRRTDRKAGPDVETCPF